MRNDSSDTKCNGRAVSSETVCDSSCRTVVVNLVSACFLIAPMATPACAPASGSPPAVATNESSSVAGKWNAYLVAADGLFRFPGTLWFVAIGVVVVAWEAVSSLFAEGRFRSWAEHTIFLVIASYAAAFLWW